MIETDKNQILLNMMTDYAKNNPDTIFCYTNAAILYKTPRWDELPLEIHTVQSNKKIKNQHDTSFYFDKSLGVVELGL